MSCKKTQVQDLVLAQLGEHFSKFVQEVMSRANRIAGGYELCTEDWERLRVDHGLSPSRGLGDTIAKATKAVGIKPCGGCNERRKKLNKVVRYRRGK